ncbi:MAG: hypothetical protein ACRDPB_04440, partial [Nocardioidaceae bacterium]
WRERSKNWLASFRAAPQALWDRALAAVHEEPPIPPGVEVSLVPVVALLETVGDGLTLTSAGYLPPQAALGLDERFEWSQEYALGRVRSEADIHQLTILREHVQAQRLLTVRGKRITVSANGRRLLRDPGALWLALVSPEPRWPQRFVHDALAVLAAVALGGGPDDTGAQVDMASRILESKWTPVDERPVDDTVDYVWAEVHRAGWPLGWWSERSHHRLTPYGRAAAACWFRAAATRPLRE